MYTAFYGLTTSPFALTPDPQFLYRSTNHDKCLRYLSYSLERGHGLSVLTGKMGTGKTLVLNTLVQSFEAKTHRVFLPNAPLEFLEILHYISHELSIDIPGTSKAELCINLKSFLLTCAKSHAKVVLIIDDAHTLSLDVLAEVKLLTDFEHAEEKLLHIILVGQPQLASLLKLPALTPLRQRIGFHYHLLPLAYDGFLATLRDSRLFGISSTCIKPSTPTKNAVKRESKRRSIFDLYYINEFLYYKIRCRDETSPASGPQCRDHWIYAIRFCPLYDLMFDRARAVSTDQYRPGQTSAV